MIKLVNLGKLLSCLVIPGVLTLQGCQGIFSGVYDDPESIVPNDNQLYIDASDWTKWHYIDFDNVPTWVTYSIPMSPAQYSDPTPEQAGIYTYYYEVFGAGISNYDFLSFYATETQPEPETWTIAVHRNNVRTNNCGVYETDFYSLNEIPESTKWLESLNYEEDEWNQTDVWAVQDKMLSGIIGNQGIKVNKVLSRWLKMDIPPMPPAFSMNRHVFILRLPDKTYAALQLSDYMSAAGNKCCLTINYKYPLL